MRNRNLVILVISLLFCLFFFSACSINELDNEIDGIGDDGGATPPKSESSTVSGFIIIPDSTKVN